jgi:DNA-binding CsgD family transcriptional regulator
MFDSLLQDLSATQSIHERNEGVAFFAVAKTLHPISSIFYIGLNIPIGAPVKGFMQCTYSDRWVKYFAGREQIQREHLGALDPLLFTPLDWGTLPDNAQTDQLRRLSNCAPYQRVLSFPLRSIANEIAVFGVVTKDVDHGAERTKQLMLELQILGNYFHQHILRIHGHDAESAMLVSARELDCLKWAAAGKTAWESSVILGISERTVRFHLNAAREKLNCLTTTQAVAKAVSQQMI